MEGRVMHAPLSQKFILGLLVTLASLSWLAALLPADDHASIQSGFLSPRQMPLTMQVSEMITSQLTVNHAYALQEQLTPVLTVPLRIALVNQVRDTHQQTVAASDETAADLPVSQVMHPAAGLHADDTKLYADNPVDTITTTPTPHPVSGKSRSQPDNLMKVLALYYMLNR